MTTNRNGIVAAIGALFLAASITLHAQPTPPATKPATRPAPPVVWNIGQKVEVKWGGHYREASIKNRRGDWYLVNYGTNTRVAEWVEPWRIRKVGSTVDEIGYARPNPGVMRAENPPTEKPGPAPEPMGRANARDNKPPASEAFKDDPTFKKADREGAAAFDLTAPPGAWNFAPDPAKPVQFPAKTIALSGAFKEFFAKSKVVVIARSAAVAFVLHANEAPGKPAQARVEKIDLAAGRSTGTSELAPGLTLMDASPDANRLLLRSNEHGAGKRDRLEIWDVTGATAKRALIFFPYDSDDWTGRDVQHALFVDATHVLTCSSKGKIDLWDTQTCKAVYSGALDRGYSPALSASCKYLAVPRGDKVIILDTLSGKARAQLTATLGLDSSGVAFSPSGKQLVSHSAATVQAWELSTGQLWREFAMCGKMFGSACNVVADGYVLIDGGTLVDLEHRVALWKYEGMPEQQLVTSYPHGRICFVTGEHGGKNVALRSMDMPHADALKTAATLKSEDMLLFKPGLSVSLVWNAAPPDDDRQAITKSIEQQLAARQVKLADGQLIQMVITTESGKPEERTYAPVGAGPFAEGQKVTVTPTILKLTVECEGKPAWTATTVSQASTFLRLKEGQTIDQAVADASQPHWSFLRSLKIPTITKPRDPAWLGSSKVN